MTAIKFLLLSLAASSADSHFLPIKEDPADALAARLIKGAGIESEDSEVLDAKGLGGMSWKKPSLSDEPAAPEPAFAHKRLGPHDLANMKIQPIVSATALNTPKEWESTAQEASPKSLPTKNEPLPSVLVNDGKMLNQSVLGQNEQLLHEIITERRSHGQAADWEVEPKTSRATEIERELEKMAPKEVVKVSRHDTVVHKPAAVVQKPAEKSPGAGLDRLGETIDFYSQESEAEPVDEAFSLHHGHYHPTAAPAVPAPIVSAPVVVAAGEAPPQQPMTDKPSPLGAVHHSKRASPRFPIAPEDVHQASQGGSTTSTDSTSGSHSATDGTSATHTPVQQLVHKVEKRIKVEEPKPSMPSATGDFDSFFKANAIDGQLEADDVAKVFEKMKVQRDWNWQPFDLNGDGKLSHREFVNAATVAQRFKVHKK